MLYGEEEADQTRSARRTRQLLQQLLDYALSTERLANDFLGIVKVNACMKHYRNEP